MLFGIFSCKTKFTFSLWYRMPLKILALWSCLQSYVLVSYVDLLMEMHNEFGLSDWQMKEFGWTDKTYIMSKPVSNAFFDSCSKSMKKYNKNNASLCRCALNFAFENCTFGKEMCCTAHLWTAHCYRLNDGKISLPSFFVFTCWNFYLAISTLEPVKKRIVHLEK